VSGSASITSGSFAALDAATPSHGRSPIPTDGIDTAAVTARGACFIVRLTIVP
jgi:hypothetical protein